MEARIPFDGFYESIWSREVDDIEEQEAQYLADEEYEGFDSTEVHEIIIRHADYNSMFKAIAAEYVSAFQSWLEEETGVHVMLHYNEMLSPKEYNFETDRLFVEVELAHVNALVEAVGKDKVAAKARRTFTSRDGFISFYDPDIEEWGAVETWDHNQLYVIFLAACIDKEPSWDMMEVLREPIYNAFQNNVNWMAVHRDIEHKIDVQNGDAEHDARKFPDGELSMEVYVQQFGELNNLK